MALSLKLGNSLSSSGYLYDNIWALGFNGTDESVTVDAVASSLDRTQGTIIAWVKLNTMSTTGAVFQARVDSNNFYNLFYHASSNEMRFTYKANGTAKVVAFTDAIEADGKWHHVMATWETAEDEVKIYLDGTLKQTATGLGNFTGTPSLADIGQNTQDGAFFNGNIAEVGIFAGVIPVSKVFVADREPVNLTAMTRLKGYYQFNSGSGTVAVDSSGNGFNGTLVNTPTWSKSVPYKAN